MNWNEIVEACQRCSLQNMKGEETYLPQFLDELFSDKEMSHPVRLNRCEVATDADNGALSFIYDRQLGFIRIGDGFHQESLKLLYALRNGFEEQDLDPHASDKYLEYEGVCYFSSVGCYVYADQPSNLNRHEKQLFESAGVQVRYLRD